MSDEKKIKSDKTSQYEEDLLAMRSEAEANLHGWKKALADYQNLQRDSERRLSQLSDFTLSATVLDLLPIFDNYETALQHVPEANKSDAWVKGLEHTFKLWENFLKDHSIKKITTIGEKFDPQIHEAIGHVTEDDKEDQVVVQEAQSGYMIKDSVLRPAKVIINNIN